MKPRLGISSCLLGKSVRYDGGHKANLLIAGALEQYFELIPVCPEVDCGMDTQREPMRLQGSVNSPRLVTLSTRIDKTDQLNSWTQNRIAEMKHENIAGFVFKSGSPSCGLTVNISAGNNNVAGAGIFARRFSACFSRMPVAEDEQLRDDAFRETFIQRVLTFSQRQGESKAAAAAQSSGITAGSQYGR